MGLFSEKHVLSDRLLGDAKGDIARFCFERAVEHIRGGPAHRLLMSLALFVPDASREALGHVASLPNLDRDEGLVKLEWLSLVNKRADRFAFLPLTKSFALAELAEHSDFKKEAARRWVDYLKGLCQVADSEYYWRYRSYLFLDEGSNILEAIEWSYENGTAEDVFLLILAANEYLDAVGDWNRLWTVVHRALSLARTVRNPIAVARFATIEGWMLSQWGEYEEAESRLSEALERYQEVGNREGKSIALHHLSAIYRKKGLFNKAEEFCNRAWSIADSLGIGDLRSLVNIERGKLARDMGRWELARGYFAQVRDWFEERAEQDPRDEILARSIWGHLAIVEYHLGRPREAKELCLKSLEFFEAHGTKGYLATLKYRLALAEDALGEHKVALEHAREAVDWFDRLGMKPDYAEAKALLQRLQGS